MKKPPIYVLEHERPHALHLPDLSDKPPRYRGRIISRPDYELEPLVEHTQEPGWTVVESRKREAEAFRYQMRDLGGACKFDGAAFFEFACDNAYPERSRYRLAKRVILKSHFGPNIANPNVAGGRCNVVCARGADTPRARRMGVAILFGSFMANLPASGTCWRGVALGPELFVLDKVRGAGRPRMALALVGAGYNPNVTVAATEERVRPRRGAESPEDWVPFAVVGVHKFDVIEAATAAPFPGMLAAPGERNRLAVWGARGVTAKRDAIRDWENALSVVDFEGWSREAGPGWLRRERQDGRERLQIERGAHV